VNDDDTRELTTREAHIMRSYMETAGCTCSTKNAEYFWFDVPEWEARCVKCHTCHIQAVIPLSDLV
jgi:hypothetical protein